MDSQECDQSAGKAADLQTFTNPDPNSTHTNDRNAKAEGLSWEMAGPAASGDPEEDRCDTVPLLSPIESSVAEMIPWLRTLCASEAETSFESDVDGTTRVDCPPWEVPGLESFENGQDSEARPRKKCEVDTSPVFKIQGLIRAQEEGSPAFHKYPGAKKEPKQPTHPQPTTPSKQLSYEEAVKLMRKKRDILAAAEAAAKLTSVSKDDEPLKVGILDVAKLASELESLQDLVQPAREIQHTPALANHAVKDTSDSKAPHNPKEASKKKKKAKIVFPDTRYVDDGPPWKPGDPLREPWHKTIVDPIANHRRAMYTTDGVGPNADLNPDLDAIDPNDNPIHFNYYDTIEQSGCLVRKIGEKKPNADLNDDNDKVHGENLPIPLAFARLDTDPEKIVPIIFNGKPVFKENPVNEKGEYTGLPADYKGPKEQIKPRDDSVFSSGPLLIPGSRAGQGRTPGCMDPAPQEKLDKACQHYSEIAPLCYVLNVIPQPVLATSHDLRPPPCVLCGIWYQWGPSAGGHREDLCRDCEVTQATRAEEFISMCMAYQVCRNSPWIVGHVDISVVKRVRSVIKENAVRGLEGPGLLLYWNAAHTVVEKMIGTTGYPRCEPGWRHMGEPPRQVDQASFDILDAVGLPTLDSIRLLIPAGTRLTLAAIKTATQAHLATLAASNIHIDPRAVAQLSRNNSLDFAHLLIQYIRLCVTPSSETTTPDPPTPTVSQLRDKLSKLQHLKRERDAAEDTANFINGLYKKALEKGDKDTLRLVKEQVEKLGNAVQWTSKGLAPQGACEVLGPNPTPWGNVLRPPAHVEQSRVISAMRGKSGMARGRAAIAGAVVEKVMKPKDEKEETPTPAPAPAVEAVRGRPAARGRKMVARRPKPGQVRLVGEIKDIEPAG
ncbi:hypothetical protein EDC01DRAFT_635188 [Geopyxis carbonaria]|nr:hypothetical protein EDC01DRAFT_635188 [Geopyxis carbonaria]